MTWKVRNEIIPTHWMYSLVDGFLKAALGAMVDGKLKSASSK
jgi:hypothetical protein